MSMAEVENKMMLLKYDDLDREKLVREINTLCRENKYTVATAESCTAGGVSNAIASVSRASEYLLGGIVCYSEKVKKEVVGVPDMIIKEHGVVSPECARSMSVHLYDRIPADFCLGITGYAGETGGDEFAERGTVCISVYDSIGDYGHAVNFKVDRDRASNIEMCINVSLWLLVQSIKKRATCQKRNAKRRAKKESKK